ncbi:arginine transporter [Flavimaricola marinus]|uniref:Arginine transporter n=1 Tax=Flavimaricola marinus TaxID=1819565 RepID=A0A238LGL5_9RHOB|nr:arginine transporter [Flavimaricola marinus]SMY08791.1 hypothetical protein LOM8899_02947 [Flavimaricola marinus]
MHKAITVLSLALLAACGGASVSGPIGNACMDSGRSAAGPILCACVQGVADQTLSSADQRRAATFFEDPDKAQETRTSDNASSEAFWDRYRAFSDSARQICG